MVNAPVTLAQLITRTRARADMTGSLFVTDAEITTYLVIALAELYDILTTTWQDYNIQSHTFSLDGTTDGYALWSDFYKLRGVEYANGSEWITMRQINYIERNEPSNAMQFNLGRTTMGSRYGINRYYRLGGILGASRILIYPNASNSGNYRIWYIPTSTDLVNLTDSVNYPNHWEEFAVLGAAIKCLIKQETDVSQLLVEQANLRQTIRQSAGNRNAGDVETIGRAGGGWNAW